MEEEFEESHRTVPKPKGMADPEARRWEYLRYILYRPGPWVPEEATQGTEAVKFLERMKVLVIGAGGLGCEILKNLALSGFKDIHVIDMDTIDVSNLNRQFLFRQADVGKYKAEVAAKFVMNRVKGVSIEAYCGKIQDKDESYYKQFNIIVCGLDSVEARRWINATLVDMVDLEDGDSIKPLVDGGTEGFKGQTRVIIPSFTACIECQLELNAPRAAVPLCTLATIPRQPQHCIEWAHIIAWEEERKGDTLDTDDPEHITWLYQKAAKRAAEFNITGVTYSMTQGVVKNIIPAIASTNAIIAASCCNEAFKIATAMNPSLGAPAEGENNYMMYSGDDGVYTYTYSYEKKEDCPVCGITAKKIEVDGEMYLRNFMDLLAEMPDAQLKKPTIRTEGQSLYYQAPASLEEATRHNLSKKLSELLSSGDEVAVSDPAYTIDFRFQLIFK
ncbi:putative NEDD8 activating enzyme [Rhizodiscina lignyota]|uniref:NEDD8-activating enzyme E1 catalytic subunit n=1 Tax=Rhizodiscina lignyota TaxID=1504668 RepID=A0A9P4ICU0_9PEZI|nr:putative NEDD8 activating enzyme [Rhizodiscina lignyota]